MDKLAKRLGFKTIYGIHKNCIIGLVPGLNGISVGNSFNGIIGSGIPTVKSAKKFIDNKFKR